MAGFAPAPPSFQSIRCTNPDTNPHVGEVVYLRGVLESYWRSTMMWDEHAQYDFRDLNQLQGLCRDHPNRFLEVVAPQLGNPRHFVLKHPQLTVHFPLLHTLRPDAHFLIMVRDPRDLVASAVRARAKGATEFGKAPPVALAQNILQTYQTSLSSKLPTFAAQVTWVRYEDLVHDPLAVARQLTAATGIDLSAWDPTKPMTRSLVHARATGSEARPLHSRLYGAGVSADRVHRYSDTLTPAQAQRVAHICAPLMQRFGYPAE